MHTTIMSMNVSIGIKQLFYKCVYHPKIHVRGCGEHLH